MATVTIYHNPRCSKSRQTLQLLRDRGIEPVVIEYLHQPPDEATLKKLVRMLDIDPIDLIRRREEPFKTLNLADKADDESALIAAMAKHPILIERPIVVHDRRARLGRPPQQVLEIL